MAHSLQPPSSELAAQGAAAPPGLLVATSNATSLEHLPPDVFRAIERAAGRNPALRQLCKSARAACAPLTGRLAPRGSYQQQQRTEASLSQPAAFQHIHHLDLSEAHTSAAFLRHLPSSFPHLRSLVLSRTEVTAAGLAALAPLRYALTSLSLAGLVNQRFDMLASLGALTALAALTLPSYGRQGLWAHAGGRGRPLGASEVVAEVVGELGSLRRLPALTSLEFSERTIGYSLHIDHDYQTTGQCSDVYGGGATVAALASLPALVRCNLLPRTAATGAGALALLTQLTALRVDFHLSENHSCTAEEGCAVLGALAALAGLRSLHLGMPPRHAARTAAALLGVARAVPLTSFGLEVSPWDAQHPGGRPDGTTLQWEQLCSSVGDAVAAMRQLSALQLGGFGLDGASPPLPLASLAGSLAALDVGRCSDIGAGCLQPLRGLRRLKACVAYCGAQGIGTLSLLEHLDLGWGESGATPERVEHVLRDVALLTALKTLRLCHRGGHAQRDDAHTHMALLQELRQLERLTVEGFAMGGAGWGFVPGMARLRALEVYHMPLLGWQHMLPAPPQLTRVVWYPYDAAGTRSCDVRPLSTPQEVTAAAERFRHPLKLVVLPVDVRRHPGIPLDRYGQEQRPRW